MSEKDIEHPTDSQLKVNGIVVKNGVRICEKRSIDSLSQRGYGTKDNDFLTLAFYEALYLLDKELLEVKNQNGAQFDFQTLLQAYEKNCTNAWFNYLVYRDLRSRGYVVREGFGTGIDFRVYSRGTYGKGPASYMVLGTQEGKPTPIADLAKALRQCRSEKKELVIAVMNRRGETVYYTISQLTFK